MARRPALHVRRPSDQRLVVPEPDRLAVPLRKQLRVILADQYFADEVVGDAGEELHLVRRHEHFHVADAPDVPPAHEPFGVAERRHPLRRVVDGLVVIHLRHARLVLGRQQRQHRRSLRQVAVQPLPFGRPLKRAAKIPAVPVRKRRARMRGHAAVALGLRSQRLVVFLGGLVRVRAHELVEFHSDVAVAPMPDALAHPHVGELGGRVAARVTRVGPVLAVEVVVLRRE